MQKTKNKYVHLHHSCADCMDTRFAHSSRANQACLYYVNPP